MLRVGLKSTTGLLLKATLPKIAISTLNSTLNTSLPLNRPFLTPNNPINLSNRFHHDLKDQKPPKKTKKKSKRPIPGVKHVFCVSSGKGGVGKSTVAVNLALALSSCGKKIGILDADVHGPSIPKLLALDNELKLNENETLILPKEKYGLKCMSMGLFLNDESSPVVWRGLLVSDTLKELIRKVNWSGLDILVIDFPPGTGDAQLSVCQEIPISGSVVVSTPQDVALSDVKKGTNMLKEMKIPILGLIQNMSYFKCPDCGKKHYIFGDNEKIQKMCKEMDINILGELPLDTQLNKDSDNGCPLVYSEPENPYSKVFKSMAQKIIELLGEPKNYIA